MERIARIATGRSRLRIVSAGSRMALELPADLMASEVVIRLYQPQRLKGRIFRLLARLNAYFSIARHSASYRGDAEVIPQTPWLRAAADAGSVGFLGCNPAHGWRCVLAGIEPESGERFVAKLGLDGSAGSVRREDEILRSLHGRFPGVVQSLGCEYGEDWALLRLPHLGDECLSTMSDSRIGVLLESWMRMDSVTLSEHAWSRNLIERVSESRAPTGWHQRMMSLQIRRSLTHGDFAVWNLRATPDGLTAIDWEWGQEDGIAGIDLVHGLRQECYMVRSMSPERAVRWMLKQAESPIRRRYLDAAGWIDSRKEWLALGLLHSHFNACNPSGEILAVLGIHVNS